MGFPVNACSVQLNVFGYFSAGLRVGSGLGGLLTLAETFVLDGQSDQTLGFL